MKNFKVLLIGQPNVGKSCLLNALVGSKVIISNYPGTTVETFVGEKIFNEAKITFEDTPGIYSISDRSEEEKITEKRLLEETINRVVVVADSISIERSLYIVLQILEAQIPVIIALNFVEEAEKRGVKIDHKKLEKTLGISVVPINPLRNKGITKLIDTVLRVKEKKRDIFNVRYDDDIEKAIDKISSKIIQTSLPKRFIALRILEKDEDFYIYLEDKRAIEEAGEALPNHPRVSEDIAITRYGTAAFIAREATRIIKLNKRRDSQEQIDKILLHNIWGPIFTIFFFITVFGFLLLLGNLFQGILLGLAENASSYLNTVSSSISIAILSKALYGLMAGISVALPYVFLFYIFLGLIEDVGLLPRFVLNLESLLRKFGLPGKAFIPLALGFGCTVPAVRATRILSSQKERYYTSSFFPFIACSSRTAIIMGIVGYYGGILLAIAIYFTLAIAGLIWSFIAKKIIPKENPLLLLELPPYRKPLTKNIFIKGWIRMRSFVYLVIPLLVVGGVIYAILETTGLTNTIIKPLSPITQWLGLPAVTIIPLVFGFLQKDLTGGMLLSVLGNNISSILTPLQIYTFGLVTVMQIPCIIALGMLIKEFGVKKAASLTGISMLYGLLFAGLAWRIISIF